MPQIAIIFQEILKLGGIILKDYIVFGSMAGAIGGAVGLIFSYIMFLLGFTPLSSIHLAATLVTIDVLNLTTGGIIFSLVTHFAVASQFGILLLYILKSSGKDFWIFKGISIGAIFCLVAHSYLIPLMRTDPLVRGLIFNAPSFGTMITTHSLIGLITAFIIVKYYYKFKT